MMSKPFEEIAVEWKPRAKRFVTLIGDRVVSRVKRRLPSLLSSGTLFFAAVLCVIGIGAWLSTAAWISLRESGLPSSAAAGIVAAVFAVFGLVFFFAGRTRGHAKAAPDLEVLHAENHEIEEAGRDLLTLFKDLTIAAKHSLSPNEVLKPHAVKVAVASTALGFLVALNLNVRKERMR